MIKKRTTVFENALIWFGAGVSIAEILTGTYFASLGLKKGLLTILIGHIIGCTLFFLSGLIGGYTRRSSMDTVKLSFGKNGSTWFAVLNILQLAGWTAIMIYDGALSAVKVFNLPELFWAVIIGGLVVVWISIGIQNLGKLNVAAMLLLFVLTFIISFSVFGKTAVSNISDDLSFGAAIELSVAMPLSWLPLISDYTKEAEKPFSATLASTITYFFVSMWMYIIGMSAAIFTGGHDFADIILKSGLGIAGLIVIIFSTVTTTFLDAYSAGVSAKAINEKLNERHIGIAVAIIGTIAAIIYPMDNITGFLYFIGSVFAPMIAIQIADYFILKKDRSSESVNIKNMLIWLFGFALYRYLMRIDIVIGSTLPDMLITLAVCMIIEKIQTN